MTLNRSQQVYVVKVYLEHSDEGLRKTVKGAAGFGLVGKVELASEHLHAKQGEDDYEEEEEQQQAGNGADRVQEGSHQITERCPVSSGHKNNFIMSPCLEVFQLLIHKFVEMDKQMQLNSQTDESQNNNHGIF